MPESPQHSNASASLIVGLAAAVILALGVGVLVYNRQPPPASPTDLGARPVTVPGSTAPTEPKTPEASPQTGGPTATDSKSASAASSAPAKGPGPKAVPSGRAGQRPAPAGARTPAGPPPPLTAQAMLRRSFVPSRTASENVKGVSKTLSGFDSKKSKEVNVKRAPEIDGRIEFSATPARVKAGDRYSLRVSLVNEGKRTIDLKEVAVTTSLNRKEESGTVKPLVKQVAPRQNEVIHEISGTWDKTTASFAVEVRVLSNRLDMYRNELVWK